MFIKSKIVQILSVILISFLVFCLIQTISAQPTDSSCKVEIIGGTKDMYPGQLALLTANVTGGQQPLNYSWTVEGPIIKDYDDSVYNSTYMTSSLNIDPPTFMTPIDFQKADISFYWQPNKTDAIRTVSVHVLTSNGSCNTSKEYTIAKNNNNTDLQAEDFYVEKNHPVGLTPDNRVMTRVLQQHQQWHRDFPILTLGYANNGDLFFDFHRSYIAHFDAWRSLFGYPPITSWDPSTVLPKGVEFNHTKRSVNETNPYSPIALPPWFKNQPGADGPENRSIMFIRSFDGQNQLPNDNPLAGKGFNITFDGPYGGMYTFLNGHTLPICEEFDYVKNGSKYPRVQDALQDFPPDQKLLGCSLTDPYHDDRHSSIGGDMGSTASSPRDPMFWRFHKYIDSISAQRFSPFTTHATALSQTSDTIPPRIISQNPFRLYPYITALPTITENEKRLFGVSGVPAISAQFNEPVIGVKANDFTINGFPATQVSGNGSGPYVFIGFKTPMAGKVNVTLSSGNITDMSGNRFEGTSWNYYIIQPNADKDKDGLQDGIEVNSLKTNPLVADSDGDSIPDGIEATTKCLNPIENDALVMDMSMRLINNSGLDTDKDNITNVQEFHNKTDPCTSELKTNNATAQNKDNNTATGTSMFASNPAEFSSMKRVHNDTKLPFAFYIKKVNSFGQTINQLQYNSFDKQAVSTANGSKSSKLISLSDDITTRRILNDSGFFSSNILFYPPPSNNKDYSEYSIIAMLNGKMQADYWTDISYGVPNAIKNLPFILGYVLDHGQKSP